MTCADHNRAHCPEPRCHVLAVCAATIAPAPSPWYPEATKHWFANWADVCGYPGWRTHSRWQWQRYTPDIVKSWVTGQIADRLVAWMRWDGAQPCGPCEGTGVHAYHGSGSCESCRGSGRVPGQHPLDAVMAHVKRVAALECQVCRAARAQHRETVAVMGSSIALPPVRDAPADVAAHLVECDGINWAAAAALLDQMETHGIGLDAVHEWRKPGLSWPEQCFEYQSTPLNALDPESFGGEDFPKFTGDD